MTGPTSPRAPIVLVVDDDPVLISFCAEALGGIGFDVRDAETGEEALASIERSVPDLVLLDVWLPGQDGFATCEAMRALPELADVPILIMTGDTDSATIDRAFEVGATDFIGKPLDWQLLQHRVRFVMRANTAFKDLEATRLDLEESRLYLKEAREIGEIGTWELDRQSGDMVWSAEMYKLAGATPLAGGSPSWEGFLSLVHPDDRPAVEKAVERALGDTRRCTLEHRLQDVDGRVRFVHQYIEAIVTVSGEYDVRGTIRNITENKLAQAQINYLETFDTLTRLPNRNFLRDRMERLLGRSAKTGTDVAILCVDLDRFERINRGLGHATGDELLRMAAERLLNCVRATDFVGRGGDPPDVSRFGGDEFTIVLSGKHVKSIVRTAATRILRSLADPFQLDEHTIPLSASIGIAISPRDGSDPDTLITNAASAMSWAKESGGGSYRFFDAKTNQDATRQLVLEGDLTSALQNDEFVLEYQPQVDAETGRLEAVEALVRWNHPTLGRVPPNDFIPVAEASGLVNELGEWVLRQACAQQRRWDEAGLPRFRMCVNVSSVQFSRAGLTEAVASVIEEFGVQPGRLELEITETALLGDGDDVLTICERLRDLGVGLALDDFGTGYSSLSHLFRFQIDTLKIDRSFVAQIDSADNACGIIAAVIAMARRMGITVIAEGVEDTSQEAFLRQEDCHLLQGYGLCRPVPPAELEAWIRAHEDPAS